MFEQLAVPARAVGGFVEMALETFRKTFQRPFQFREFLDQTWMIARVSLVDTFGEQALFYGESMRYIPNALTRYRKETIRLIAEITMGTGALVLIGGTVGVAAFLTLASGGVIAVQGYESLGNIGIAC